MTPGLAVELAPKQKTSLALRNPVMPASGTFSWGMEFSRQFNVNRLGAVVSKGVTPLPRSGNPQPRVVETPSGMLNSIGLQNLGPDRIIAEMAPVWADWDVPVIVNLSGETVGDYGDLARAFDGIPGVAGLELNFSCPNVDNGLDFGLNAKAAAQATRAAVRSCELPVIVKLTPAAQDPAEIAQACAEEGASAICAINTLPGLAIDTKSRRPVLPRARGGLSGPAIKPVALRVVYEIAQAVSVPVIGCGGISSSEDAIEFLMAGATAIQVGTATFSNPRAPLDVLEGLEAWLEAHNVTDVHDIIGCAQPQLA